MKAKKAAWFPWLLCAVVILGFFVNLFFTLSDPETRADAAATVNEVLNTLYGVTFGVVGALILSRLSRNRIGWLLMATGLSLAVLGPLQGFLADSVGGTAAPTPSVYLAAWLGAWSWWLLVGPLLILLLVFPTGHLLSPRWRWLLATGALLFLAFIVFATVSPEWQDPNTGQSLPNPLGTMAYLAGITFETIRIPWTVALVGTVALCVLSVFVRYRRSGAVEREQLKWFLYACGIFIALFGLAGVLYVGVDPPEWLGGLLSLSFAFFPLSIGVAILRYRLYDIDIIIRRTLVYIPLTAILAGVFSASIKVTQALFTGLAGTKSEAATVLTTLIVVAAFDPLKGWLQRTVDARFKDSSGPRQRWLEYGKQVRAYVELNDAEASARRLLEEAAAVFEAKAGAVYLKRAGEMQPVHTLGDWPSVAEAKIPLEHQGSTVGQLLLGARRNGRRFKPDDLALLADNATAVAAAIAVGNRRYPSG